MLKEFRDFAIRGNVIDLAIGVIIGAAFGAIVSSLVDDVFMPLIGLLLNVGMRLPVNERAGRGKQLMAYFLWDWFDGALRDGW